MPPFFVDQGRLFFPRKAPAYCGSSCPPFLRSCHSGKEGDLSLPTSSCLSDSKNRKHWFIFPSCFGKTFPNVFLLAFPSPHFPTNDFSPQTSVVISVARVLSCLFRQRGLLLARIQLEAGEEKPVGKETFHPSLGTETKSRLCFFSVPAKNLITPSKPG